MNWLKSRYPFAPIKEGAFFFVTDAGSYYTVDIALSKNRFGENTILNNHNEVYEISFARTGDVSHYDPTVSNTLIFILFTNLSARGDTSIYFYVCDTTDGLGKARARLFDYWMIKLGEQLHGLEKYNFIVPGFEKDEYDVSLFIFKNHPNHDAYIIEFEKCLRDNFSKHNFL